MIGETVSCRLHSSVLYYNPIQMQDSLWEEPRMTQVEGGGLLSIPGLIKLPVSFQSLLTFCLISGCRVREHTDIGTTSGALR